MTNKEQMNSCVSKCSSRRL